jgi:ADP-ribose pyrophosphatase YjhB (NUDIX family)
MAASMALAITRAWTRGGRAARVAAVAAWRPPVPAAALTSSAAAAPPDGLLRPMPFNAVALDFAGWRGGPLPRADLDRLLTTLPPAMAAEGRTAVWVRVDAGAAAAAAAADVIASALGAGFSFHHASGSAATLLKWLRPGPSKVPPFATHTVGVGGVVVDDAGRVLVVQERAAAARAAAGGAPAPWKFPGGLADAGEDFGATAVREVAEETGVAAAFRAVLAMRHAHGAAFGVSDVYVLALLRAAVPGGREFLAAGGRGPPPPPLPLAPDPGEIAAARWVDAREFAAGTSHPLNRHVALLAAAELDAERAAVAAGRWPPGAAATPAAGAPASASAPVALVASTIAESEVYIPVTRKWTKVYASAGGPPIAPAEGAPAR